MRRIGWTVLGILFGIAVTPVIAPVLLRLSRPIAKAAAKAGVVAFRSGRERLALLRETLDDILAETRSELGNGP